LAVERLAGRKRREAGGYPQRAGKPDDPRPTAGARLRRGLGQAGPLLYVAPALFFVGLFIYWPLVQVTLLSFFRWNLVSPERTFVGLENFARLVGDPGFLGLLVQSFWYIVIALLGNFLLPLGLAMLTLQVGGRYTGLYQGLLFTPTVVATSIGALLWQWIYLPSGGPLNALLGLVGLPQANWLNDPSTALTSVGVVAAWKFLGFNYIISLAGLLAVPREYLEAARVDGATGWPLLRWVLVPLLMPTILFIMLTSILHALPNVFIPVEILTRGGPSNASNHLLYSIYQDGFQFFQIGDASAKAFFTVLLLGAAAIWQFRLLERNLEYDR
jgi:ABC-type sugar transport system permease subunit